ncbi:putative S-adenosyl-L-methionine-dependent methyltransferase [Helianthus anomalus]
MLILNRSRLKLSSIKHLRRLTTSNPRRIEDEGDWFYSSEWWDDNGNTVFRSVSDKGNGVVSVVASHASRPNESQWYKTENWLGQRYAELRPRSEQNVSFRILGYQWRTLRFNDVTRQSTAKVMTAYNESDPGSIFLMQQAHCLAVPYLKSMISAGLTSLSCNCDMLSSVYGKTSMKVLCIGHGGGSLPLFLACKIPGAMIDIVEIDPVVISASTLAMGFPSYSIMKKHGERSHSKPNLIDKVIWNGIHERLFLYEADAEQFITESTNIYDMVFVDAYDGDDIFPRKLWDPDSIFLKALGERVHPEHGTVVVNLHSDIDIVGESLLPMGKYVSQVCKAYKKVLLDDFESISGLAFTVHAPWVCNASLVVSRGFRNGTCDTVLNTLISKSLEVENTLNLPFSCLQYIKRGLMFVD